MAEEEKISVIIIWLRDFGTGTNWNYCKNLVFKSLHSNLNEIGSPRPLTNIEFMHKFYIANIFYYINFISSIDDLVLNN